jgi:hypothetical protein
MRHAFVAALVAAAASGLAAPAAQAGEQQGVRCPSGFTALISDANRKLVCRKVIPYERDAICAPTHQLENAGASLDQCVMRVPNTALVHRVPPTALPIATSPWEKVVSELAQVANPNGLDRFVATIHQFAFPEGGSLYVGDASTGVVCPVGFDGDKVFNERGIRCDKHDGAPRSADCDGIVGWEWKRDFDGAEDRCRNFVTGATGPTKPEGMSKVQHDLERSSDAIGWVLDKNAGARDTWQRKVYKYPIN